MEFKPYILDRVLYWLTVLLLLFMVNLTTQIHYTNWEIKGQILHRQDAVEFHASVGLILLLITFLRLVLSWTMKSKLPRTPAKSPLHGRFVKVFHFAMYSSLFLLILTGLGLVNNYEIPLTIYGAELIPVRADFLQVFPTLHEIHLHLQTIFWWLIAIHFIGFLYSKK